MGWVFEAFSAVCIYHMKVSLSFETKCSLNISQAALIVSDSWNSKNIWRYTKLMFCMDSSQRSWEQILIYTDILLCLSRLV